MTLTDLVSSSSAVASSLSSSLTNSLSSGKTATQTANGVQAKSTVLQKAETRIQAAVEQTTTRLSTMGKLKSAVSEVQLASRALHSLTTTASGASVKLAASSLVTAYNNAIKTARVAAAVTGAPSESASAKRASRELLQSVAADATTLASLKKLGISVLPDGTLALDSKVLDATQAADPAGAIANIVTLGKLGSNVDKAATQSLESKSNQLSLGSALSSLNLRATALKAQQAGLATLAQNLTTAAQNTTGSGFGSYGLSAYLK
jgi:hypothetical protein